MQSITWEALLGLWTPAVKFERQNVWNQCQLGEFDLPTARRMLMTNSEIGASRIRPPEWWAAGWRP